MAHKKGQGSSRNGRDSNPQYRGIKISAVLVTSLSVSAEHRFMLAKTSVLAVIGRSSPSSMAPSASRHTVVVSNASASSRQKVNLS